MLTILGSGSVYTAQPVFFFCARYNVTHIVLDVQELERDSVDITAINGMGYRVASNGRWALSPVSLSPCLPLLSLSCHLQCP
jgi:hypothetical protein